MTPRVTGSEPDMLAILRCRLESASSLGWILSSWTLRPAKEVRLD